jgi:hypothetical protein
MTPGELTARVASATGVPETTVTVYARVLREAGLLTTGARGVNAPPMSALDAARLLIALVVTERPSRAADAVADFGQLPCGFVGARYPTSKIGLARSRKLQSDHVLEEATAMVIDIVADGDEKATVEADWAEVGGNDIALTVDLFDVMATLTVPWANYLYDDPAALGRKRRSRKKQLRDPEARALKLAYGEMAAKYRTRIRTQKKIPIDVFRDIAAGFMSSPDATRAATER